MRATALLTCLVALALPTAAQGSGGPCPFSSITVNGFGTGTGTCAQSILTATLDTTACDLNFTYQRPIVQCGNVFLYQNVLLAGPTPIPAGVALGAPFVAGSSLYVVPAAALGPFTGTDATVAVPQDAGLIGQSLTFQSVPFFFSTFPFPGSSAIGTSTGLTVTLH